MVRRRRLARVGSVVMIYWWGEGVEELEGTLNLRTVDALRGAGGVGYRSGQWDGSSCSCYSFRLSHCLMLWRFLCTEASWDGLEGS